MQDLFGPSQPLRLFPEKLFYKIGEVSRITGVESYVLRYWETEFPFLSPRKSKSGQRIYTKRDIELVLQIKRLLYEERYTIDGVRRKLGGNIQNLESKEVLQRQSDLHEIDHNTHSASHVLALVKSRLREILNHHFGA